MAVQTPGIQRLVQLFQSRPDLYEAVLTLMRTPLEPCEGHRGPCQGNALWPTASMTAYVWDGQGEDPNRPRLLCPACSETYIKDMSDQWDDYYRGLL